MAAGYGLMALLAFNFIRSFWEMSGGEAAVIRIGVCGLTHLVVLCCLLRRFSCRALAAQATCVLLTNLVMGLVILGADSPESQTASGPAMQVSEQRP
jgi:hypothetical protein